MSAVLIIEDDEAILRGLSYNLKCEGYDVFHASNGKAGYELARDTNPDLIILDLMLPGMSGDDVCRKLRAEGSTVPVLMLTARSEEADRVRGLDLGADDYVTKPFSIQELLARVRALRRRIQQQVMASPEICRFGDISVNFEKFEVLKNGVSVDLTRKEFGILRLLTAHPGKVFSREALLNAVWGYEQYPTTRTVDNHIASLRSKLEAKPSDPRRLLTVFGVGYKFVL